MAFWVFCVFALIVALLLGISFVATKALKTSEVAFDYTCIRLCAVGVGHLLSRISASGDFEILGIPEDPKEGKSFTPLPTPEVKITWVSQVRALVEARLKNVGIVLIVEREQDTVRFVGVK